MSAYLWAYAPERLTLALSPIVRRLALIASLVALITAIAWLALESASMADDWTAALDPSLIGAVLTDTAFGPAWAAHLVLAATVAVVVFGPRARWAATAIASAALLASLGLVGHAAMQTGGEGVLHRANHALHLLTTGAWVGGLVPFAMCLRAYRRGDLRRELGAGDDRLFLLGPVHRRGDYSHRRRQHRVDVRPPPNPADHALPRGRRFPCRASSSTARRCATSPLAALATARSTTKWEAPGSRASRPSTSSPSSRLSRPAKGGTTSASRCATSRGG